MWRHGNGRRVRKRKGRDRVREVTGGGRAARVKGEGKGRWGGVSGERQRSESSRECGKTGKTKSGKTGQGEKIEGTESKEGSDRQRYSPSLLSVLKEERGPGEGTHGGISME